MKVQNNVSKYIEKSFITKSRSTFNKVCLHGDAWSSHKQYKLADHKKQLHMFRSCGMLYKYPATPFTKWDTPKRGWQIATFGRLVNLHVKKETEKWSDTDKRGDNQYIHGLYTLPHRDDGFNMATKMIGFVCSRSSGVKEAIAVLL